jgi:O-antigen/teichoic acid export membrane protein
MQNAPLPLMQNVFWSTVAPAAFQIIRILLSILVVRLLEPKDFGVFAIASAIIYYTNNFSSLGLGNSIVQKKNVTEDHINSFFTFNLLVSIGMVLLCYILANKISVIFEDERLVDVILSLSTLYIITAFYAVPYNILRRNCEFKTISMLDIISSTINLVSSLILAYMGFNYWSLIIGTILANVIATIIAWILMEKPIKFNFQLKLLRDIIGFGIWNFIYLQTKLVTDNLDKLLIGKMSGPGSLGLYDKGNSFANIPNEFVTNKLSNLSYTVFARNQDQRVELQSKFKNIFTVTAIFALPAYIGLYFIADDFVNFFLGDKWVGSVIYMRIFAACYLTVSFGTTFYNLNLTCGLYKQQVILTVILSAIAVFMYSLIYINKLDIIYFAYCMSVINAISAIISIKLGLRILKIPLNEILRCCVHPFLGSLIMILIMWLFRAITPFSDYNILVYPVIGFIGYSVYILKQREYESIKAEVIEMLIKNGKYFGIRGKKAEI